MSIDFHSPINDSWVSINGSPNMSIDVHSPINDSTQVSMDPLMMSDGINDMSTLIHNLYMMMSNGLMIFWELMTIFH